MKKAFWEYFLKNKAGHQSQLDDSGSGESDSHAGETGRQKPPSGDAFATNQTYLLEETEEMHYERRGLEQKVERQLAYVEERRKPVRSHDSGPGQAESLKQHPLLDSQRFDGIDPSVNPAPFGNQEAMIEFENERREQELEKQLRLGNVPKMGNKYIPELKM